MRANDGVHGQEVWQSNGSAAGTKMVLDINPGPAGSFPSQLVNSNGTLFFAANDGVHGVEPWVLGPVPAAARAERNAAADMLAAAPSPGNSGGADTLILGLVPFPLQKSSPAASGGESYQPEGASDGRA